MSRPVKSMICCARKSIQGWYRRILQSNRHSSVCTHYLHRNSIEAAILLLWKWRPPRHAGRTHAPSHVVCSSVSITPSPTFNHPSLPFLLLYPEPALHLTLTEVAQGGDPRWWRALALVCKSAKIWHAHLAFFSSGVQSLHNVSNFLRRI